MKDVVLKPTEQPSVWLEAEAITPDAFAGKSIEDIKNLAVVAGNRKMKLGDFFEVSGTVEKTPESIKIVIDGDVSRTKRIGQGMSAGEILIKGSVDMYVGAKMRGGKIVVNGNAAPFAGQQMEGGELTIKGNAGNYLGASYRGDWKGMKGGTIVVEGNAGSDIAEFMTGGKIHIKGSCGQFAGVHMKGGLVIVEGSADGRVGAQMTGGKIVVLKSAGQILPGFTPEGSEEIKIEGENLKGTFLKYTGDNAERDAKGTLYVSVAR